MERETIEEAAKNHAEIRVSALKDKKEWSPDCISHESFNGFLIGAEWQADRMYNEINDFINWIDSREIPREDGSWVMYFNGIDNNLTTKELFQEWVKQRENK